MLGVIHVSPVEPEQIAKGHLIVLPFVVFVLRFQPTQDLLSLGRIFTLLNKRVSLLQNTCHEFSSVPSFFDGWH